MAPQELTIPKGSTVLVSGANGYIASTIIDILLELGYKIRGTVRSEKPWLNRLFEERHGKNKFESVVVPDLAVEGAFDDAVKGVAAFVHVATDVSLNTDADKVVTSVVKFTNNALEAAAKEPSVKRFILTSSSSSAILPRPGNDGTVVEKDSWNDLAVKLAFDDSTPAKLKPFAVYAASKTEGERAAWKFVQEHKPGFILNTILPNFNTGPILHPEMNGSTMGAARNLLKGDTFAMSVFSPQYYIDVRDTARLHIAALLDPSIKNERIFGFVEEFNWTDFVSLLRKLRPNNKLIPDPPTDDWRDMSVIKPKERAEEILQSFWGKSWIGFEESVEDGIAGWD